MMILWANLAAAVPALLVGAISVAAAEPAVLPQTSPDSTEVHKRARDLQNRFERRRVRELPRTLSGGRHGCDEIIGRLCVWDDSDEDWQQRDEPEAIGEARAELLATLDSLASLIPGDHWIFGQRIRYLVEAKRLPDADMLAQRCGLPERWPCDAYRGYVLYHNEDVEAAEAAFRMALDAMPPGTRGEWTDPEPVLDDQLLDWLSEEPDSARAADRLWMLADPLFLTAGNDRWAAHLARWVYAMSSEGARNPHQMMWGRDLTEAAVRYGWPVAWERSWPSGGQRSFTVTGRDQPAAVRTFPPGEVLGRADEDAVAWEIPEGHTRSVHLPPFLDTLAPLDGQVGRFWRGDGVVIAGAWTPPDPPPGDRAASGSRLLHAGLFVEQGGSIELDVRTGTPSAATVRLSGLVPWADWGIVSLEGWAPGNRRAYRLRAGVGLRHVPRDVLSISDLMLLDGTAEPADFAEMLKALRGSTEVDAGEAVGVALEVYGLGFQSEVVGFNAWVEKKGEGILTRAVRWLGIGGPKEQVAVAWEEPGPDRPRPLFRSFRISLPVLDAGQYDVVVEVSVAGRAPLSGRRSFTIP